MLFGDGKGKISGNNYCINVKSCFKHPFYSLPDEEYEEWSEYEVDLHRNLNLYELTDDKLSVGQMMMFNFSEMVENTMGKNKICWYFFFFFSTMSESFPFDKRTNL